jgi:hypothetical protein
MPDGYRHAPDPPTICAPNTAPPLNRGFSATSLSVFYGKTTHPLTSKSIPRLLFTAALPRIFPKGDHPMAKSWLVIGMLTAAPLLSIGALARGDHGPYTRTLITYPTMTTQATVTPPGLRSGHRISK